jgi:hypothetical protein
MAVGLGSPSSTVRTQIEKMCVCGKEVVFASLMTQLFDMVLKKALGTTELQSRPSVGVLCG